MIARLLLALFLAGLAAGSARSETLIASISSHQIQISSNYTGDQLTVFGIVERDGRSIARGDPYDIVITVRGPRKMLLVREKEQVGPVWINRTQRRFSDYASFLSISSSRPLTEILSAEAARRERIGLVNANRQNEAGFDFDIYTTRFRDGLLRQLEERGLYSEEPRGVTFLSPTLFSAPVQVPAIAPTGSYDVDIVLYSGGVALARESTNFEVVKTGVEQGLAPAAHDWPWAYGLATILLALAFGWLASVVFRRD